MNTFKVNEAIVVEIGGFQHVVYIRLGDGLIWKQIAHDKIQLVFRDAAVVVLVELFEEKLHVGQDQIGAGTARHEITLARSGAAIRVRMVLDLSV